MRWRRRDRRTARYQALGEDFLRRMDQRTDARCAAIKACHDGPDAMAALLDDLGRRIAAERARHGIIPEPAPMRITMARQLFRMLDRYVELGNPSANTVVVNGRRFIRNDGESTWSFATRAATDGVRP